MEMEFDKNDFKEFVKYEIIELMKKENVNNIKLLDLRKIFKSDEYVVLKNMYRSLGYDWNWYDFNDRFNNIIKSIFKDDVKKELNRLYIEL